MVTKSLLPGVFLLCALATVTEGGQCLYKFIVPNGDGCSSADATTADLQSQISNLAEQNTLILKENMHWRNLVDKLLNTTAPSYGDGTLGAVFIRWGRTKCPDQSIQLYNGYAAGSHFSLHGGSSELLCLPQNPQWGAYRANFQGRSYVYGAEYQTNYGYGGSGIFKTDNAGGNVLHDQDVPCAACYTKGRAVAQKFPATLTCPEGWQEEYHGYLMAGLYKHETKVQAVCMDEAPEVTEGGKENHDGALVYNMEAHCGSLPCPKYVQGRELTCVICSR